MLVEPEAAVQYHRTSPDGDNDTVKTLRTKSPIPSRPISPKVSLVKQSFDVPSSTSKSITVYKKDADMPGQQ